MLSYEQSALCQSKMGPFLARSLADNLSVRGVFLFAQSVAALACRDLGFKDGVFADVTSIPANVTLLPAWLGAVPCVGSEATLADCDPLDFGNTWTCGLTQRLACSSTAGPGSGLPLPCPHATAYSFALDHDHARPCSLDDTHIYRL